MLLVVVHPSFKNEYIFIFVFFFQSEVLGINLKVRDIMIVLFSILLFSKPDRVLVLCCIYLYLLIASTRRVQINQPIFMKITPSHTSFRKEILCQIL
jgi:hypothetical protein